MYATYMGQKPCIDEGHGMTQERDLYIQLDMANREEVLVRSGGAMPYNIDNICKSILF